MNNWIHSCIPGKGLHYSWLQHCASNTIACFRKYFHYKSHFHLDAYHFLEIFFWREIFGSFNSSKNWCFYFFFHLVKERKREGKNIFSFYELFSGALFVLLLIFQQWCPLHFKRTLFVCFKQHRCGLGYLVTTHVILGVVVFFVLGIWQRSFGWVEALS